MMNLLIASAALMAVQEPAPIPAPTDIEVIAPAVVAPDCGGLLGVPAFCVGARMDQIADLADAYVTQLEQKNWLPASGDDNRIIFVKRREGGGCDGMQMLAFFDTSQPQAAEAPAFIGFANIPGDICAAPAGGAAQ